jgi:hypothetical protein
MTAEIMLYPLVFVLLLVPVVTLGWAVIEILKFILAKFR